MANSECSKREAARKIREKRYRLMFKPLIDEDPTVDVTEAVEALRRSGVAPGMAMRAADPNSSHAEKSMLKKIIATPKEEEPVGRPLRFSRWKMEGALGVLEVKTGQKEEKTTKKSKNIPKVIPKDTPLDNIFNFEIISKRQAEEEAEATAHIDKELLNAGVRNVWQHNLLEACRELYFALQKGFKNIAVAAEFPGKPIPPPSETDSFSDETHLQYHFIKSNVNQTRLIQLGLSLSDPKGNQPDCINAWQFNFKFNPQDKPGNRQDKNAIKLLKERTGINLNLLEKYGVSHTNFTTLFGAAGFVAKDRNINWVFFQSAKSLAYMLTYMKGEPLPETKSAFFAEVDEYFPWFSDMTHAYRYKDLFELGTFNEVASRFPQIPRSGTRHEAGSHAQLTGRIYVQFTGGMIDVFNLNHIWGLGLTCSPEKPLGYRFRPAMWYDHDESLAIECKRPSQPKSSRTCVTGEPTNMATVATSSRSTDPSASSLSDQATMLHTSGDMNNDLPVFGRGMKYCGASKSRGGTKYDGDSKYFGGAGSSGATRYSGITGYGGVTGKDHPSTFCGPTRYDATLRDDATRCDVATATKHEKATKYGGATGYDGTVGYYPSSYSNATTGCYAGLGYKDATKYGGTTGYNDSTGYKATSEYNDTTKYGGATGYDDATGYKTTSDFDASTGCNAISGRNDTTNYGGATGYDDATGYKATSDFDASTGCNATSGRNDTTKYGGATGYDDATGYKATSDFDASTGCNAISGYHDTTKYGGTTEYNDATGCNATSGCNDTTKYGGATGYDDATGYKATSDFDASTGCNATSGRNNTTKYGGATGYDDATGYKAASDFDASTGCNATSGRNDTTKYGGATGYDDATGYKVTSDFNAATDYLVTSGYKDATGYKAASDFNATTRCNATSGYNDTTKYGGATGYDGATGCNATSGYKATSDFHATSGCNAPTGYDNATKYGHTTGYNDPAGYNATSGYKATITGYDDATGYNAVSGFNATSGYNATTLYDDATGYNATTLYDDATGCNATSGYKATSDFNATAGCNASKRYEDATKYGGTTGYDGAAGYESAAEDGCAKKYPDDAAYDETSDYDEDDSEPLTSDQNYNPPEAEHYVCSQYSSEQHQRSGNHCGPESHPIPNTCSNAESDTEFVDEQEENVDEGLLKNWLRQLDQSYEC